MGRVQACNEWRDLQDFTCQFCKEEADETITHLVTCPYTMHLRQSIFNSLQDFLVITLSQFSDLLSSANLVNDAINGWIETSIQSPRFIKLLTCAATGKMDSSQFIHIQRDDQSAEASILDDPYLAPPLKPPIITSSKDRFLKALNRTFLQIRALIHSSSSFSWLFKKLPDFYKVNLLGDEDDLLLISSSG
ncbi:hypothetical protein RCL_jg10904.t1 [Rhizophagus clarus]|uniref:Uncharacterized protein n=1 Tax=Rhizophagus clarus TaxID=94130 RepID=A0A8H3QH04_9GLOM|nr:hypothetical protein RCL_jg10904.t1 [Rhizophagus clarus]